MTFSFEITTPANTPKDNPKITSIKVSRGILVQWNVIYPEGSHGLLSCQIWFNGSIIVPFQASDSLTGNNVKIGGPEFIEIFEEPLTITIKTWNKDINYEHMLYGQLFINPLWSMSIFSEKFKTLLEKESRQVIPNLEG